MRTKSLFNDNVVFDFRPILKNRRKTNVKKRCIANNKRHYYEFNSVFVFPNGAYYCTLHAFHI